MSTANPFAYNTGSPISGTQQIGSLSVGFPTSGFTSSPQYWNGPNEDLGYVIAVPVSGNTQPTPITTNRIYLSTTYKGTDIQLSNNNQTASQLFGYQQSVLGINPIGTTDKVMFSVLCTLAEPEAAPDSHFVGVGYTTMNYSGNPYGGFPGNDNQSMGYGSNGDIWFNGGVYQGGLQSWGNNDIIDIVIDNNTSDLWVRVNGGNWNSNPAANPATGSNGIETIGGPFYPVLCPAYQGTMIVQNSPAYSVPSGYNFLATLASVAFYGTKNLPNPFSDETFIYLTNISFNQSFSSATEASIWLTNNGYWNSYVTPVLYLDAGNPSSYPGTGTVWTDLIGGKVFNLINGPGYDSANGGKFYFYAAGGQYANCSTSLQSLPTFTTSVWHYWDGNNTAGQPCILTEVYPGNTGNINYILGSPSGYPLSGGYFGSGFQLTSTVTLTPNNWYNIVLTCETNQQVKIYLNGTLATTVGTAGAQPSSSQGGINLMRRWDNPEFWGGYLSTVGIYDKALTQSQISSIFNSTKSRYGL
jgi:hypothetical protein